MKRIGIITIIKANNYGAELQAYALQKKINLMGYNAEIIDYLFYKNPKFKKTKASRPVFKFTLKKRFKEYAYVKIQKLKNLLFLNTVKRKEERFFLFHKNNTQFSATYDTIDLLYKSDIKYDIYVSGSDQIWNPNLYSSLEPYFLTFAPKGAKKISYASSFGISHLPNQYIEKYKRWLEGYKAISVRENTGVKIIEQLGLKSEWVLDPTLLLTKGEWTKIEKPINVPDKYILVYELINSKFLEIFAAHMSNMMGYKVVRICKDVFTPKNKNNFINIMDAGPAEFVYLFNHADYIITNSFHGSAFSINFNKNFYVVLPKHKDNNSRQISLLELFKLQNRIIYEDSDINSINISDIEYNCVNKKLNEQRELSINFILNSINE